MENDLISRQAAIDAFEKYTHLDWKYLKCLHPMLSVIEEMPSAQPEIIHCRDCEKYGTKFCAMDTWTEQVIIRRATPDDFCSKISERQTDG